MRYLYGDLTQADCQADMLGLLQRVVEMGVEVLGLHQQAEAARLGVQQEQVRLAKSLEDVDRFHASLQQTIHTSFSDRPPGDVVSDIGQAVTSTLQQSARDGKVRLSAETEQRVRELGTQVERFESGAFEALKRFFLDSGIEVSARAMRCELEGASYLAQAEILDTAGLSCSFALDTSGSAFFSSPKRFGDLLPGRLELPLGTKKAWMKKDPVPQLVRIDDTQLVRAVDINRGGEYRLLPKGGPAETVVVQVLKAPQAALKVFRPAEDGQLVQVPAELLPAEQAEPLARFWTLLEPRLEALYATRRELTAVHLEGKNVLEGRLFPQVIARLVTYLAPAVREIDAHSLVPGELSLTVERDDEGRREVFFVRKEKLVQRITALPESLRRLFAPLRLDPSLSAPPGPAPARAPAAPPSALPIREVPRAAGEAEKLAGVVRGVLVQTDSGPDEPTDPGPH